MPVSNYLRTALLVLVVTGPFTCPTRAADLSGAWATDASVCSKVFVKHNGIVDFAADAELFGGGLIIEGKRVTGTFQKCSIKSMKDEGADVRIVAACSTGVMVSDVQLTVKIVGNGQITLIS